PAGVQRDPVNGGLAIPVSRRPSEPRRADSVGAVRRLAGYHARRRPHARAAPGRRRRRAMRSERGALPALVIVLALVALFAVVAYVLFTGEGLDDAGSADAEALAMSGEEAVAEEPVAGRSTASEREASAEELLPDESLADAAEEDPDAIPEDATGVTGTVVD